MSDTDQLLRRLERTALAICAGMALVAAVVGPRRAASAAGVLAGGALAAVSYRGIKAGTDALVSAKGRVGRGAAIGLVKFFTRYAILAAAAYVTIVRLRLPPIPIFVGASSFVVAVTLEALRGPTHRRAPVDAPPAEETAANPREASLGTEPSEVQWKNSNTNSGSSRP